MEKYHIVYNGEMVGPIDISQLKLYGLTKDSMVCKMGETQTKKAFMYPELMAIMAAPEIKPNTHSSSFDFSKLFCKDVINPAMKVIGIVGAVTAAISSLIDIYEHIEDGLMGELFTTAIFFIIWWIFRKKDTSYKITPGMQVGFGIAGFFFLITIVSIIESVFKGALVCLGFGTVSLLITNFFVVKANSKV